MIKLVDMLERALSRPVGLSVYLIVAAYCGWQYGWDGVDRYLTLTGGVLLVVLLGSQRRSDLAVQARLDHLAEDWPNRIEELPESEIERLRAEDCGVDDSSPA